MQGLAQSLAEAWAPPPRLATNLASGSAPRAAPPSADGGTGCKMVSAKFLSAAESRTSGPVTELDASTPGSTKVLGAMFANPCSTGSVSTMAALSAATSEDRGGLVRRRRHIEQVRERRRQAAQEFRFRRRELRGREGQAHLVGDEGSDHGGLQGREAPDQPGGGKGVLGAGVCSGARTPSCAPAEAAACGAVERDPHPDDGLAEAGFRAEQGVERSEGACLLGRGRLDWGRQGEPRREDRA